MFLAVDPSPPPITIDAVRKGFDTSELCRKVLDAVDLADCLNQVSAAHRDENIKGSDFSLGFSVGSFAQADHISAFLEGMGRNPATDLRAKAANDVALVSVVGLEKQAASMKLTEEQLVGLIGEVSGVSSTRWNYWRAKPLPDWLAKQFPK